MQPQQLRQFAPDRHLAALGAFAAANRHDALAETNILDTQLHQLRGPYAGLEQRLQHDAGAPFSGRAQAGTLACRFEHRLALRIVDALADQDAGDRGGGAFEGVPLISVPKVPVSNSDNYRMAIR